jgi:glutamate synthase (NADPH) large chain
MSKAKDFSLTLPYSDPSLPPAQGLYDPRHEKDACGVGMIARLDNAPSHDIVQQGLQILANLDHRGAVGADPLMGDGCGILIQIPDAFLQEECARLGFILPEKGTYGVGHLFLPRDENARHFVEVTFGQVIVEEGLSLLGWRDVPVNSAVLRGEVSDQSPSSSWPCSTRPSTDGLDASSQDVDTRVKSAHDDTCYDGGGIQSKLSASEPVHRHIFIGHGKAPLDQDAFERKLFMVRKRVSNIVYGKGGESGFEALMSYYPVCLSSRTLVYKGLVLVHQLGSYYRDLSDERLTSALALVHQRFATNTFPSWRLAHPYRMVAHNGEINTLRGNVNGMAARQANVDSELFGNDISKLWPISYEGQSDTACFDNALEFLVQGGYSLPHAVMMLIPEAWAGNPFMSLERKAFYAYHAALMEPWDGPAAMAFTDGRYIGATLDRNGLRPARYLVTDDGIVVMASESGVLPISDERIIQKGRLQPGCMLLIDLEQNRIIPDYEIKTELANANPYQEWLKRTQIVLEDLSPVQPRDSRTDVSLLDRQQAFGYTQEDVKLLMAPMAVTGQEAVGSMGTDTPLAVLSKQPKLLYHYFKQNFAQVTNPPIDPIREELVMSLVSFIGPRPNILDLEGTSRRKRLEVRQPILTNADLEKIRSIGQFEDRFDTKTLDVTYPVEQGEAGLEGALERLCERAIAAVHGGYTIIILSDRRVGPDGIPLPMLLATAAVHHALIRQGLRTSVGLVVESGEPREVHHFCCLAGYGAEAINPYLAFDTLHAMQAKGDFPPEVSIEEVGQRYIKSIGKGLLKVMAKMGISTYQSYCGAQIFDAIGLSTPLITRYFFGTSSAIEGIGLPEIAEDAVKRHSLAFGNAPELVHMLAVGGDYLYRERGEAHSWTPDAIAHLQHAVRLNSHEKYKTFANMINDQTKRTLALRGLWDLINAPESGRKSIPLDEVEPAALIVRRFATGAMSYGSLSKEAHETMALAANAIGAKSNTGEGGEEPHRFKLMPDGRSKRSAIKQIASGRFGVTAEYLVNADVLQIKMAQGAKPGEGGQLPGHKVDARIARVRHSTAGVGLISPPPHHDIYSIEDLAQLIFDLKNVNPQAAISVKLVSEAGVGTVAAGVAKARADHITISGYEGGTGASPLTSIKHAGSPWELGLSETHQTLVLNGLRSRVALQVDGGLRTGRDVIFGALLGADEFAFATAPLIAAGCVMMRKCHLNTCPVGVATQDPVLRKRFKGTPEHVINYLFFVAEEVREIMAELGFKTLNEMIGRTDLIRVRESENPRVKGLDFSRVLYQPHTSSPQERYHTQAQEHPIANVLDRTLIDEAQTALENQTPVTLFHTVRNTNRTIGAMLSGEIAKRYGHQGLPDDTITVNLEGTAGQSFGAFASVGLTLNLTGQANDYVGKGLSGGKIIVRAPNVVIPSTTVMRGLDPRIHGLATEIGQRPQARLCVTPHGVDQNPAKEDVDGRVKHGHDEKSYHERQSPHNAIIAGNTILYGAIAGECYIAGSVGERFAVRNSGALAVVEGVGDHGCEYMTGGVVVVLGRTGRNFAAGMSGGIAYVLDEEGTFSSLCNLSMVDLEPVEEEDNLLEKLHHHGGDLETKGRINILNDILGHDEERLLHMIHAHVQYTGSAHAQHILDHWSDYRTKFVKVMPLDYRKALEERSRPKVIAG